MSSKELLINYKDIVTYHCFVDEIQVLQQISQQTYTQNQGESSEIQTSSSQNQQESFENQQNQGERCESQGEGSDGKPQRRSSRRLSRESVKSPG